MEKKHIAAAVVILSLLAGVGWALFNNGEDAKLAEAKQLRDEMFKNRESLSDEERRAQRDVLREKTRDFTDEQRREFGRGIQQFMLQRVDALIAMPKEQQNQELDKWIDRMEEGRKRFAEGGGRGGPGGNRAGGEGRGNRGAGMTSAERDQRRKQRLDRSTPEMRAKMDAMKDLINDRREERGLEPIRGGRGMFGRGGPR